MFDFTYSSLTFVFPCLFSGFLGVGEERRILFSKFRVSGGPTEVLVLSDPSSDEEGSNGILFSLDFLFTF